MDLPKLTVEVWTLSGLVLAHLLPIAAASGIAVMPWAMMLMHTVQTTTLAMVMPPEKSSFNTIIVNTILARPLGPNQPRNNFE